MYQCTDLDLCEGEGDGSNQPQVYEYKTLLIR